MQKPHINIIYISFLFFAPLLYAKTIQITSDTVSFQQQTHQATYEGNVILIEGRNELHADKLITQYDSKGDIHMITAIGHPTTFSRKLDHPPPIHAKAETIYYCPRTHTVVLKGSAMLKHQEDSFHGPILSYHLKKEVISATRTEHERPVIILHPHN